MDDRTKRLVENGVPVVIAHLGQEDGKVLYEERFNMENLKVEDWQIERLAHVLYPAILESLSDPKLMNEFEKWKEEHNVDEQLTTNRRQLKRKARRKGKDDSK